MAVYRRKALVKKTFTFEVSVTPARLVQIEEHIRVLTEMGAGSFMDGVTDAYHTHEYVMALAKVLVKHGDK
jgi:hypothetical protein